MNDETIKTQTEVLARLEDDPGVTVERYVDDGVSGTIPLAERPAGGRLMRDAAAGRFDEFRVYKFDRLGRDALDLLGVGRAMRDAGVSLRSVVEGVPDLFMWDILAAVADNERRTFLRKTADGIERAAPRGPLSRWLAALRLSRSRARSRTPASSRTTSRRGR